jgi:glycosyltransferase involved in cell wall biosynthesis
MTNKNYLMVSPCKNEEDNLPYLIESVVNQTHLPEMWFIFNDGSTDGSNTILEELESEYDWVYVHWGSEGKRDLSFHYSKIVDYSLKKALSLCEDKNISINYLGLIDSDMVLSPDFFEKIIERFDANPEIGIASGSVIYDFNNPATLEKGRNDLPIGGLRVWRKECFIENGGLPITYSADAVSNVIATLQGWGTVKYDDIVGKQSRKTSSAEGLWKGYGVQGKSDYYRDYHPIYVMFKFIKNLFRYPFYPAFGYMKGYLQSVIGKVDKIQMPEVRTYYRNKHKEVVRYYVSKFKS